jgi:archaellum biogenesis ATPase FlaH
MVKEELIQRSAVKALEKMVGGLEAGELGVICSPSGLGKTSVLVQIALYKLMQEQKVVHVSFTQQTSYVFSWYEDILDELIKNKSVANAKDLLDDLFRNRVILNFNQKGVNSDVIRGSLRALLKDGGFNAQAIIIDGFDFSLANAERLEKLKGFAKEAGVCLWYSCTAPDTGANSIPAVLGPYMDEVDVLFGLHPQGDHIALTVNKNRGNPVNAATLKLDPKTLLLAE